MVVLVLMLMLVVCSSGGRGGSGVGILTNPDGDPNPIDTATSANYCLGGAVHPMHAPSSRRCLRTGAGRREHAAPPPDRYGARAGLQSGLWLWSGLGRGLELRLGLGSAFGQCILHLHWARYAFPPLP